MNVLDKNLNKETYVFISNKISDDDTLGLNNINYSSISNEFLKLMVNSNDIK